MSKVEIIKRPVEQIGSDIKKTAWAATIESLALLILGVLFVIWPETMVKILAYIVGVFFIVKGGNQIVNYYMEKGQNDFFNNKLLTGVVSVLLGIAAITIGEDIAHVFSVIIGILIIYESLVRINAATKLASANIKTWQPILTLGLLMLVIGVIVTFLAHGATVLVGWMMILTGIVGLVGDIMFIKHLNILIDKITGAAKTHHADEKYEHIEEAEVKEEK